MIPWCARERENVKLKLGIFIVAGVAVSATFFLVGSHSKSDRSGPTKTVQPAEHKMPLPAAGTNAFGQLGRQGKPLHVDSESNMVLVETNTDDTNFLNKSDWDALYDRDSRSEILSGVVKKPEDTVFNIK